MNSDHEQPERAKSELIRKIAVTEAGDPRIRAANAAFDGQVISEAPSLRVHRVGEAAKLIGRSRWSIWRSISAGRIRTVQLRAGGLRLIPEAELHKLVAG